MMKRFYNFSVAFIVDVEQILKPIGGFPKAYAETYHSPQPLMV